VQTSTASANTRSHVSSSNLLGFTRVGVNPLQTLKSNIPGCQLLREGSSQGSRFNNYD
jgi:LPS-assembly protein